MSEIEEDRHKNNLQQIKCICSGESVCQQLACARKQFIESAMGELCEFLLQNETERTAIKTRFTPVL